VPGSSYSDADAVHYLMLQRNLLYTVITRAIKLVVLVGPCKAIGIVIHNDKVSGRCTGLAWRLANKKRVLRERCGYRPEKGLMSHNHVRKSGGYFPRGDFVVGRVGTGCLLTGLGIVTGFGL
jgi:hypothetical protein